MKKIILLILPAVLFSGCTVKEKEKEITVFRNTVSSVYTGKVKRKLPDGEGTALMENDARVEGLFEKGTLISGEAGSVPYSITYKDREISGIYTGEVSDQFPSGSGTFTSGSFSYEGIWNEGVPDGKGSVSASDYLISSPDETLEGSYSGDFNKGRAEGTGTFIYQNGKNEIQMTGNFAGDRFDGLMVKTIRYQDNVRSYPVYYRDGQQVQDTAAMIAYLEGMRKESYCLSEAQYTFISDHSPLFERGAAAEDAAKELGSAFDPSAFREDSSPSLILIRSAVIRSVQRYKPYTGADTVTSMIVQNNDGWYHLVFAWPVTMADKGDVVDIYALPLCRTTLTAPEQDYPAIDAAGAVMIGG